ncbi:mucin-5AC-like [Coregonus clupeaformis]|uniref:mucin-5AC-like n=1 Tax=Coregonus clupeaformis TaxID=59861 RepID=UPI001E1C92AF|nr:mucin-5AC-like [Coregonus clupeaformis]
MSRIPEIAGVSPIHNGQVCSTWGNYHFKTFDGEIFQLPSTCNYVVTSLCHSSYEDFNIQMRRQVVDNQPTISKITMKLDGTVVELSKGSVVVNGNNATLPFSQSGVLIEETPSYIKIKAKLGLVAIWNQEDSFLVEMDIKFRNKTCGLCGDFNGVQQFDEFYRHGMKLSPVDFGIIWKLDGPTESCTENTLPSNQKCPNVKPVCEQLLSGPAFSSCKDLLAIDSFVEACVSDLCNCDNSTKSFCLCNTISEYSRQCVHAGGKPKQWRTEQFCYKTCPFNMEHQECGNPCVDTCSNPERGQLCEEHCSDGCFCPPGTVFDDVNKNGCIALNQCSCLHNGKTYAPGESFSSTCKDCSCGGGQWKCADKDCPGTCAVEGGSHINTYDGKAYTFHGDCSYVLTKDCDGMQFTVLGDVVQCGLSDSETCLKVVTLSLSEGATVINIQPNGKAFVNGIYSQLPFSAAGVTIFRASSFFIIVQTTFGLQLEIQLSPIMQVYIAASTVWKQRTCGLCGNFNNNQGDDFKVLSGVTEGTAISFANTWKTRASCPDIKSSFESPCSLSLDNEKYAQHWCSQLADPKGLFAPCHAAISPDMYKENCMYDSCNCEKSEDCMCAAVSSYVHACAAEGIQLSGWRDTICTKYSTSCPSTMVYAYSIKSSDRSCRCYSDADFTCSITFESVDGCVCSEGTYLDDEGKCVPPASCPCYYKGSVVSPGEVISKDGTMCTCKEGKLRCIGDSPDQPSCVAPMVFFNCSNASPGIRGLECQKSCNILDMACISTECISGCMCHSGLVANGKGGCIKPDLCPCSHNGATYQPGDSIKVDCNTCTCKDRKWQCTTNLCHGTCAIYGDGHYITFDGKRFTFEGDCEYTLTKDYCGNNNANGSFRVITENVPCGTTGTTCSKAIKLFLGNNELILTEGNYQVVERNSGEAVPYQIRTMGIYLVIEANNGLILMWDRKTSMFIKLNPQFKGHVCGLCGNYDGNANNDFTTRSQAVVVKPLDFGNSWKVSASCPDAKTKRSPCIANPYRQSWSQKQCSIIQSNVFTDCHSKVDPSPFYDACVTDSCACDSGGDCECFCTAVAAYAEACNEAGACIAWRSPQICPLFCDYYNPPGECEWHYKACGAQCMKTCRNPSGSCSTQIPPLEGCYPKCPPAQPLFDEDTMQCVEKEQCGCYGTDGKHYNNGEKVPTTENCQTCSTYNKNNNSASQPHYNSNHYSYINLNRSICYGWGDPHYVTFDGTYYGFQRNCSYVLVKEILPKYNFSVVIDNYYCDAADGLSCPQSLTIYYQSYEIFMTKKDVDGVFTSLIDVNQQRIIPAYETKDFRITDNGIETLLVIPAINAKVSFTGLMFSIYLPWDKFSGNTEGQCGTCDNNRTDDCRLPNGTIDSSCPDMAHQWHVADHNNSQCTPPPPEPTPTQPPGCDPPICHLIQSEVFESCHKVIPYEPFLVACIFDVCHMSEVKIGCTSMQTYADACAQAGVCIEWRNYTNGQCDFTCEKPKVYNACGPQVEPTCNAWYNFKFIQTQNEFSVMGDIQMEGCYCPNGTILMSSTSNYCIPSCDICPLPNGEWKEANETWVSNCQDCVCDPYSLGIQCQPVACQHQPPLTCDQEGQVKVVETVDCCQKDKCECDVKRCSTSKITCPVGFETEATMGVCCPTYQCLPKDVCVFNNTEYQPGANVPEDKCKNCVCGDRVDPQTHLHIIECQPTECYTHCQQGYDHQAVPGQCCGKCVQTSCVVMLPDNTTHTIQPGSVWIPSGDKCLKFECVKIMDQLITMEAKTVCPDFYPEDCIPGTEVIAPDGCCHVCIPKYKPCNVTKGKVYLDSNGCKSVNEVEVTTCGGSCGTYAMYSLEANMMERSCTCCREVSTTKKEVEMICPDGSKYNHSYIHINKCGCQRTECVTPEETQVTRSRRRRR